MREGGRKGKWGRWLDEAGGVSERSIRDVWHTVTIVQIKISTPTHQA